MNDLPESVDDGDVSLFADDTSAYCMGENVEEVVDTLNRIMEEVYLWCLRNKMSVHPGKSKAIIMRKAPFIEPLRPLHFGEGFISFVSQAECLGLDIDNQLNWSMQIRKVCKNYSKKVNALKRMSY